VVPRQVETDIPVAAVLSGPAQGATVLVGEQEGCTPKADTQQQLRKGAGPAQAVSDEEVTFAAHEERPTTISLMSRIQRVLLGRSAGNRQIAETGTGSAGSQALAAGRGVAGCGPGAVVSSVQGTDVSKHLSRVKHVSAVMDVDAHEFHQYILESLRT
jgi:hypothetical protein